MGFSKTYIPDFHLHHLLTGIHCLQQTVKAVNGEQVVTQTKKEEKANVWLLKSHMQWTHRRAVLMKAVLTAARLFPLHCRSDTEQNTQDHYSWERVVIKWHFGCPHSYFWVIYSYYVTSFSLNSLSGWTPSFPSSAHSCFCNAGLMRSLPPEPLCNPSSRNKRAIWFCTRQYLLQLLWNWNPGKVFQQETAAFIPKLVIW